MKFFYIFSIFLLLFSAPLIYSQEHGKDKEREREENDSTDIETQEMVITGTRTYKKIIDIPYSVFRVDKREMQYGRNVTGKDILADVPGLFLQSRFGSDLRISIRGFGTRSNSGIRGIRILQDGIPESDPDGETTIDAIDYTSLGGVEVVKGNLSSLYPNSPGGVINFLSDVNFEKNFVTFTNEVGEFNLKQNGIKIGIHSNKYRFFTSYSYRNFNGFRVHQTENTSLINSYFQAYLDNKTSVTILGNYARGLIRLPGALTEQEFDQNPNQAYFQAISSDIRRITTKGRLGVRLNSLFGKNNSNEIEFTGYGAIKDLQYTTNTLYNIQYKYVLGANLRYVNRSPVLKRENEFTAGADYSYVTGPLSTYNNVNGNKGDELNSQNTETQGNYGFYFQNQINLLKEKFYFLLSGRYDKMIFDNTDELFGIKSSNRKFGRFTPKAAFNFKLTPFIAVYTSYGFGFDTPSSTELENFPYSSNNGFTTLNPDLQPQTSRNYELGIKGNIINKKSETFRKSFFEFTFFNTRVDNEIIPFIISDKSYFRNAAQTNRTGLECGVKIEPVDRLEVTVNYTYTHFRYGQYISRTYDATGNPVDVDYSGNTVPAVPKHLANFILNYEYEISKKIEGLLQFDCDYVSRMFVDDQNTESTGSYFYTNSLVGVNFILKSFNILLSGGVNNMFNKTYVGFININANPEFQVGQRRYYEPGEPRSFYANLNLGYRF